MTIPRFNCTVKPWLLNDSALNQLGFRSKTFEIFTSQTSNINSGHDQTHRSHANTNAP